MTRLSNRVRIDDEGLLEIVDPGFDDLPLLMAVDPGFEIHRSAGPHMSLPRFLRARLTGTGLAPGDLAGESDDALWKINAELSAQVAKVHHAPRCELGEVSLLDLKCELARRLLTSCRLCAHRCAVDRTRGELGVCRLGTGAIVAEHFVHIAEESPVNPSLVLNLAGCGLRCRYCQQGVLLDPAAVVGDALEGELWRRIDATGARSISFVGGNPDESLYAILGFLAGAPDEWSLPVVWNCHAYSTVETMELLSGIVDTFVPDLKYSSELCAQRWSAAPGYVKAARDSITAMVAQDVLVIVRLLVLPGHVDCCHLPALDFLAGLPGERLLLSVRGQYCPDWRITAQDGEMVRRPLPAEIQGVRERAEELRLRLVDGLQ